MSSLALPLLLIWPLLPFASVHLALAPLDTLVLWQSKANVAHHLFVYSQRCPLAALYISVTPINLYPSLSFCLFAARQSGGHLGCCRLHCQLGQQRIERQQGAAGGDYRAAHSQ